jgi:hypothetical protein
MPITAEDVTVTTVSQTTVAALSPIFSLPWSQQPGDRFHVHEGARLNLQALGDRLAGTPGSLGCTAPRARTMSTSRTRGRKGASSH